MSNEPNWTEAEVEKLREIAGNMDEVRKPMTNGKWDVISGRTVAEWEARMLLLYRNDILASARAFGWEHSGMQPMRVVKEGVALWYIYSPGNSHIVPGEGFATELDAHLEMTRRAAAERDKRKKPSRKADAATILNALSSPPAEAIAALDRLTEGDYE